MVFDAKDQYPSQWAAIESIHNQKPSPVTVQQRAGHRPSVRRHVRPNPSVEPKPNGKPACPPPVCAYHPSGGQAALLSALPHLELQGLPPLSSK
jgi:hypothetical protein